VAEVVFRLTLSRYGNGVSRERERKEGKEGDKVAG